MHWPRQKAKEPKKAKRSLVERLKGAMKEGKRRNDSEVILKHERRNVFREWSSISSKTATTFRDGKDEGQEVNEIGQETRETVREIDQRISSLGNDDKNERCKMAGINDSHMRPVGSPMFAWDVSPVDDHGRAYTHTSTHPQDEFLQHYGESSVSLVVNVPNQVLAISQNTAVNECMEKGAIGNGKPEISVSNEGLIHSTITDISESKPQPSKSQDISPTSSESQKIPFHGGQIRPCPRCRHCGLCGDCVELRQGDWCLHCEDKRPILDLPIEIVEMICSFLDTADKLLFQLSCKAFYHGLSRPQTPMGLPETDAFFSLIRNLMPPYLEYCKECSRYHRRASQRISWKRGSSWEEFCLLAFDRPDSRSTLRGKLQNDYFVCRSCFYVRGGYGCRTCSKCTNCSGVWYSRSVQECIECGQGKTHCIKCRRLGCRGGYSCAAGFKQCRACSRSSPRDSTCWKCGICAQCANLLQDNSRNLKICTACLVQPIRRETRPREGFAKDASVNFGRDDVLDSDFATTFAPYSFQYNL